LTIAIEIKNVSKNFAQPKRYRDLLLRPFHSDRVSVLQNINMQIMEGETLGLLGPNGAGKTTLLKILCNLILPSKGKVMVKGFDTRYSEKEIRKLIGFVVSEERSFFWRLTGRQNLQFFATLNNMPRQLAINRINELSAIIGIESYFDQQFSNYSTGMKQKMAIARGLLNDPEILFLDEPTRALDPVSADAFRMFIKSLMKNGHCKTIILATHNLEEAKMICNRVAIIDRGRLVMDHLLNDLKIKSNNQFQYLIKATGCATDLGRILRANNGFFNILDIKDTDKEEIPACAVADILFKEDPCTAIKKIIKSGVNIISFSPKKVSLNELFKHAVR